MTCQAADANYGLGQAGKEFLTLPKVMRLGQSLETSGGFILRTIPLTKGYEAIVDDEDYERLSRWSWCYSHGYGMRSQYLGGGRKARKYQTIMLHRAVLAPLPIFDVDHINKNTLDNRKVNLRICTHQQNIFNSKISSQNRSGYKGVSWCAWKKRWRAGIRVNGKEMTLGFFEDRIEAAIAYNQAAITHRGSFASVNDIPSP